MQDVMAAGVLFPLFRQTGAMRRRGSVDQVGFAGEGTDSCRWSPRFADDAGQDE